MSRTEIERLNRRLRWAYVRLAYVICMGAGYLYLLWSGWDTFFEETFHWPDLAAGMVIGIGLATIADDIYCWLVRKSN